MGKSLAGVLSVALIVSSSGGCYSVHVKAVVPDGHGGTKPVNDATHYQTQSRTVTALFWGLSQARDVDETRCNGNGFAHVRARTNLGYSLLSVVTLGTVMLQEIEWWCATDRQTEPDPRS